MVVMAQAWWWWLRRVVVVWEVRERGWHGTPGARSAVVAVRRLEILVSPWNPSGQPLAPPPAAARSSAHRRPSRQAKAQGPSTPATVCQTPTGRDASQSACQL